MTDPSCQASFRLVGSWLKACNLEHQCYQGMGAKLPTRVINVSTEQPYLLVSNGLQGPYITLSHCWGNVQPTTTTIGTINSRIKGIPIKTLPKMFQDAVHITRRLNINYLWIDSLCIIQDSEEDWAREATQMGDIYRHSFLTIFALDSIDCHQGILVKRSHRNRGEDRSLRDADNSSAPLSIISHNQSKRDILAASPLCQRGWALQERLLSPRILYYSTEEMLWECLACTARESSTEVKAYHPCMYIYERYECANVKKRLILPPGPNPSFPLSPPIDWHIVVVEYTRCHLTKRTDKLPALSGLASIFKENTGYTYLAGLWKEDFRDGLLWFVQSSKNKEVRYSGLAYRGPSWSWMSLDSPILYATIGDCRHSLAHSGRDIKLVDWRIQTSSINSLGEIISASVTVEADFQNFWYQNINDEEHVYIYDKNGLRCGALFLDMAEDVSPTKKSCAGLWVTEKKFQNSDCEISNPPCFIWSYFLVIVPDITSKNSWRRIGLSRSLRGDEIFSGCTRVEIQLV